GDLDCLLRSDHLSKNTTSVRREGTTLALCVRISRRHIVACRDVPAHRLRRRKIASAMGFRSQASGRVAEPFCVRLRSPGAPLPPSTLLPPPPPPRPPP